MDKTLSRTQVLVLGACLLGGLLAGMAVNKVLVELPAWSEVGASAWAVFSRATDHGLQRLLFPVVGAGAFVLTVAAAVAVFFGREANATNGGPIYAAAVLAVAALAETLFLLAPPRLGLARAGNEPAALRSVLAEVSLWWDVKAVLHVLTFGLTLWALLVILAPRGAGNRWVATRDPLLAATFLGGLMAGFNLDRSLVHNVAWRELGAAAWAGYSHHADLGIRAAALYPFLGVGTALMTCWAAVRFFVDGGGPRSAGVAISAATVFAMGGLGMTIVAAPNMLSVPRLAGDPGGLQSAMEGFVFWGDIRGALQILAFFASLWSLAVITRLEGAAKRTRRTP